MRGNGGRADGNGGLSFDTVREPVALIDGATNGARRDGLSVTY